MRSTFRALGAGAVVCFEVGVMAIALFAAEPGWNPAAIKECDRACLIAFMNRYMDAIYKHNPGLGNGWTSGSGR